MRQAHTSSAIHFVGIRETCEVGNEEQVEKELDIGGFFIVLKLGVVE